MAQSVVPFYTRHLGQDVLAGTVVFFVALPLCLGIAMACGAPPLAGILAGIVGGLVVSWASGSQVSVSGPAAGLIVIVTEAMATLGSFEAFVVAVALAGIIQFGMGLLKAGTLSAYIPSSVINGMLAAIGLILIFNQIPTIFGVLSEDYTHDERVDFSKEAQSMATILPILDRLAMGPLVTGMLSLACLILWDSGWIKKNRWLSLVPGAVVAVGAGIICSWLLSTGLPVFSFAPGHFVTLPVFNKPQELMEALVLPNWSVLLTGELWVIALTIAIVASIESLLSLEAASKLDPHKRIPSSNRELRAQGIGNLISGCLGGLPITAVIVRSAANIAAGGQTRMASFVHGCLLLVAVLFAARAINAIPLAALAAILLHVGYKLTKPSLYMKAYRRGVDYWMPFVITIVAILATDLLIGMLIGVGIGLLFVIHADFRSAVTMAKTDSKYLLRFNKDNVSFLNKPKVLNFLGSVEPGSAVLIDTRRASFVDPDIVELLGDFLSHARERDIAVTIKANKGLLTWRMDQP
jgi:MFS superfamily sulfate permease-like transporter